MRVDEHVFYSYEDLLDFLKPNGPLYELCDNLIYRGQAIDWKLIPSAFREEQQKNCMIFLI